jgi:hypothetical protein
MSARLRWLAVPAALWLLASAAPEASTVLQLNLGQMVERADRIFRGTVLSISDRTVAAGGGQLPVVVYRLRVDETFRGDFIEAKGLRLAEIQTLGKAPFVRRGTVRSAVVLPRMPELEVGASYLMMTTRPSAIGLSTTVGLGQGCFRITQVGKDEQAANEANNSGLFTGMSSAARFGARAAAPAAAAAIGSGPLRYVDLAATIRGLMAR